MLSIPGLFNLLDALVIDYIERRHTVITKSKVAKKNSIAERPLTKLSLEEIYFYYLRGNGLPNTAGDKNSSKKVPGTLPLNLPNFPPEIIDQILKNCSVTSLLNFRGLSRNLNILSSEHLRQRRDRRPVVLDSALTLDPFIATFEKRVSGLGHHFSSYSLNCQVPGALRVLDLFGRHMKFVSLQGAYNLLYALEKMPNVERLVTWESPHLSEAEVLKGSRLMSLRALTIHGSIFTGRGHGVTPCISRWLQIAPNLTEFGFDSFSRIDSPLEVFSLIRSNRQLRKITVDHMSLRMNLSGNIHISLEHVNDYNGAHEWFEDFVALSSSFLQKVGIPHHFAFGLPTLPNLTSLKLHIRSPLWPFASCIHPEAFPALKHVTLVDPIKYNFCTAYRNTVFNTVNSLSVSDSWEWNSNEVPIFHIIFPQVRSLSLGGSLTKAYADYFSNNFQRISTLKFYNFGSTLNLLKNGSLNERNECGMQWPFSSLTNVKSMTFEPTCHVRRMVMDLLNLTFKKAIPSLDTLTVKYKPEDPHHVIELDKVRDLFNSLSQLKYHKNLHFDYIPRF